VIESLALGKSVLGARIRGIPELVRDWEAGITFESGNKKRFEGTKILSMLQNRKQLPEIR
jgi:glycosyltransferase involved in cell wall biosynthesis